VARRSILGSNREHARLERAARRHERAGDVRDAIAAWMASNAVKPDEKVEEHLVELRCSPVPPGPGSGDDWPPDFADPFPDVSARPPEITGVELSAETLGGALQHHGCLIVRALVDRDLATALRDATDRLFDARRRNRGVAGAAEPPWYVPCAEWSTRYPEQSAVLRAFNDECSAMHVIDSPRSLYLAARALEESGVVPVIAEYLGEDPVLSADKLLLRRVAPTAQPSWHQDGSFMGRRTRAVNTWVALTDCGEGTDAPGIAILPRRITASVRGETLDITLRPDELASASGDVEHVVPRMAPGDVLLFDELFLHANGGGRPGLTRDRYALEAWMFAPASMPDYLPLQLVPTT
jgi:ectoine hydroxylase-related dioxygenase (phytanoyl-CoA dioxygenase family)